MQSAEEILQEKLSKRVLSNKTTREGLLACMIVTVQKYLSKSSRPLDEEEIRSRLYDEAYDAFRTIGSDFEFPNLDHLKQVKGMVDKNPWLQEIREQAPALFEEYERTCQILFDKYEG
jgi:hypothetical protein